jgi:Flp pilus assembly protein TadB
MPPDKGPLSGLSRRERRRVRQAMMWSRPLPPPAGPGAVRYAPKLRSRAGVGWLLLVPCVLAALLAVVAGHHGVAWIPVGWALHAVLLLLMSVCWLQAARRVGRAAKNGYWPERPGDQE